MNGESRYVDLTKIWANTVVRKMGSYIEASVEAQDIATEWRNTVLEVVVERQKPFLHRLIGRPVLAPRL